MTKYSGSPISDGITERLPLTPRLLSESGLLWKINHDLLHPIGIALVVNGITGDEDLETFQLGLIVAPDGKWEFPAELNAEKALAWAGSLDYLDVVPPETDSGAIRATWGDASKDLTISEIVAIYDGSGVTRHHPDGFEMGVEQALEVADHYGSGAVFDNEADLILAALDVLAKEIRLGGDAVGSA